jgi:hypothetical protein
MNSIDTRMSVNRISADFGTEAKAAPSASRTPVQKSVTFSPYGSNREHIAIQIKDRQTGAILYEYPSEEIQKLHSQIDLLT